MKQVIRLVLLALVLMTVALLSALTAMKIAIHGQEVAVPRLVGMSSAEAERAASGAGLQVVIERQYYSVDVPEGRVISQLPPPEVKVRRGWQVRVAQSLGPQRISIPDVVGQSERAAELNLRRRGLDIESVAQIELAGSLPDRVVSQNPPANASDVAAPRISLLVTTAGEGTSFVMPSFQGQPLGSAALTLRDAGLRVGDVTVAISATELASPMLPTPVATSPEATPASIIVSQSPAAGQKVVAGAAVSFQVR